MRVLLIEDHAATAQAIALMLESEGFNVDATARGKDGVELARRYDYDVILLDLGLPDISGFQVLRSLRLSRVKTPLIILSALADTEHKIKALHGGADDYVGKPFQEEELVARIHALVRRASGHAQPRIEVGRLVVDLQSGVVELAGVRVQLTDKEYRVLELLSLRQGRPVSKEMFLDHLYGGIDEPEPKIIDVFICKLRKKLDAAAHGASYIAIERGRGYVLRAPPAEARVGRPAAHAALGRPVAPAGQGTVLARPARNLRSMFGRGLPLRPVCREQVLHLLGER
jgi:two-component system, cell cycle response regulator CtrA